MAAYPATASARDAFIVSRRPTRLVHDPRHAHGVTVECERDETGARADVVTVFLTGRECPWRCAMCDLWRYTTEADTPRGAIPRQIREALDSLDGAGGASRASGASGASRASGVGRRARHIKLYNAGSFFDARAVPPPDYADVASEVAGFSRVVVESHPALIGPRVDEWLDALAAGTAGLVPRLEVAMGLETAHPDALERLNKRMTLEMFRHASAELARRDVGLRVFVLISPPFVAIKEQPEWLRRSVDFAFECGASVVSLIPMRSGNGTVEALAAEGRYEAPCLDALEDALDMGLGRAHGRVFADLWDLERLSACDACFEARKARLAHINLTQQCAPRVSCSSCSRVEART